MKEVIYREFQRILKNRRPFVCAIAVPLFSLLFMATIFGSGKIENLPVGVVDCCNSPLSRQIIRTVHASPVVNISGSHIYSNEAQAKKAMQDMEIYGYIVIPPSFDEHLIKGISPTVTYYFHYALLAVGGQVESAFVKSLGEVSRQLLYTSGNASGASEIKMESVALPTNGIFVSNYNSTLNYSTFLSYPFFFVFFQIFILVFVVYTIGNDLSVELYHCAKGNIVAAVAGKLAPYAAIFITQTLVANFVFFTFNCIPLLGNYMAINISSLLFVISTVFLGIAIIALIPQLTIAVSIASMIGALGATASGITFPVENMYPVLGKLCSLFPIRHFVEANRAILYNGAGFGLSWQPYTLLLLTILLCTATLPLLKRSIAKGGCKPVPRLYGVVLIVLGGTAGYGILYGLLYNPNIVTEVPVAAIDLSQTPTSRTYLRNLDATQGIRIYARCGDMHDAEELMKENKVKGIITIPHNFTELIMEGTEANFIVTETTSSFLYYLAIQKAAAATMQQLNNTLRIGVIESLPIQQQLAFSQTPLFRTNGVAVYNHNGGYGSYLLPIAIIVILFQTMLMAGGTLSGNGYMNPRKFLPVLAAAYMLLSLFLAGLVPHIFNLPVLAGKLHLFAFIFLFILASAAFTGVVSLLVKDGEEIMLYVPFFSVGLIFLSGTSFPITGIPHFWQTVHYLLPTSPAIEGYIKLNSMGGSLQNAMPQTVTLLVQLLIYGSIFLLYTQKVVTLHKKE